MRKHHVWCNLQNPFYPYEGADNCEMCAGLRREFAGDEALSEEELAAKHFPLNVVVQHKHE